MPGNVKYKVTDYNSLKIINQKQELFIVSLKGHYNNKNNIINYTPKIKNVSFKTDKETVGNIIYEYLEKHDLPRDQTT
jgi:hypothetical protein